MNNFDFEEEPKVNIDFSERENKSRYGNLPFLQESTRNSKRKDLEKLSLKKYENKKSNFHKTSKFLKERFCQEK